MGWTIKDAWPHEPQLLLHFTRDPARHLAELKPIARFPGNLRADRVRYSERELRRVQARIVGDDAVLRDAGFDYQVVSADVETDRVEVELVTRRTDYAAYFRKRYGPVRTVLIATEPTTLECNRVGSFHDCPRRPAPRPSQWTTGGGAVPERSRGRRAPRTGWRSGSWSGCPSARAPRTARDAEAVANMLTAPLEPATGDRRRQRPAGAADPARAPATRPARSGRSARCSSRRSPRRTEHRHERRPGLRAGAARRQTAEFTRAPSASGSSGCRGSKYQDDVLHGYENHNRKDWGGTGGGSPTIPTSRTRHPLGPAARVPRTPPEADHTTNSCAAPASISDEIYDVEQRISGRRARARPTASRRLRPRRVPRCRSQPEPAKTNILTCKWSERRRRRRVLRPATTTTSSTSPSRGQTARSAAQATPSR